MCLIPSSSFLVALPVRGRLEGRLGRDSHLSACGWGDRNKKGKGNL